MLGGGIYMHEMSMCCIWQQQAVEAFDRVKTSATRETE